MSASGMVAKALVLPPTVGAGGPATCHQAALGWLLHAEGYTHAWQLLRQINETFTMPRDLSMWARDHIYNVNARLDRALLRVGGDVLLPAVGDILFTQAGGSVAHSMVVVRKTPGHVFIRGFNNAGTFNYVGIANPAIPGAYDNVDRDICDRVYWNAAGTGFGAGGGLAELRWVRYQNAATRIRAALLHWSYSVFRTPGWQHRGPSLNCPPFCPHRTPAAPGAVDIAAAAVAGAAGALRPR